MSADIKPNTTQPRKDRQRRRSTTSVIVLAVLTLLMSLLALAPAASAREGGDSTPADSHEDERHQADDHETEDRGEHTGHEGPGGHEGHRAAIVDESSLWPFPSIPVCWENGSASTAEEQGWVRDAVEGSWAAVSNLNFTGWFNCQSTSTGIRILIDDDGPHAKVLGAHLAGLANGVVLNFTFGTWGETCANNETAREFCIRAVAVHEFGHAIGLAHEHNRNDTFDCTEEPQGSTPGIDVTIYDPQSIMNYCSDDWANDGELTALDIAAARALYGPWDAEVPLVFSIDVEMRVSSDVQIADVVGATEFHDIVAVDSPIPESREWTLCVLDWLRLDHRVDYRLAGPLAGFTNYASLSHRGDCDDDGIAATAFEADAISLDSVSSHTVSLDLEHDHIIGGDTAEVDVTITPQHEAVLFSAASGGCGICTELVVAGRFIPAGPLSISCLVFDSCGGDDDETQQPGNEIKPTKPDLIAKPIQIDCVIVVLCLPGVDATKPLPELDATKPLPVLSCVIGKTCPTIETGCIPTLTCKGDKTQKPVVVEQELSPEAIQILGVGQPGTGTPGGTGDDKPNDPPTTGPGGTGDDKPVGDEAGQEPKPDEKPTDEKPTDEKPTDDKPKPDEKPTDDKPKPDEKPTDDKPTDDPTPNPALPDVTPVVPTATCFGRTVTVNLALGEVPTNGDDVILGTSGPDVIDGLAGDDFICSLGGNDEVAGGPGKDKIKAGNGNDAVKGGAKNDVIRGGNGNDKIDGGGGNDKLFGQKGKDKLDGGAGKLDRCNGGPQADTATAACETIINVP